MGAYCSEPGCAAIVPAGKCATHAAEADHARGSRRARGYRNRWARAAARFRARYPLCGMRPNGQPPVMSRCFDERRIALAYQVDHVVPHRGDPDLFWDELNNWQSLCATCGARKSAAGL